MPTFRFYTTILAINIVLLATPLFSQEWTIFSTEHGLAGNFVNDILLDQYDDLWFATDEGISRFDGVWSNYREIDGLVQKRVIAMAHSQNAEIWLATLGGLARFDPKTDLRDPENWASYTVETTDSGLTNNFILAVLIDADGNVWNGTLQHGISVALHKFNDSSQDPLHDSENWVQFNTGNVLASDRIRAMALDANNNVWVATFKGIQIQLYDANTDLEEREWRSIELSPALANRTITRLFRDKDGKIWIGTRALGVFVGDPDSDPASYEHYTEANGLNDKNIMAMAQDRDGAIWFGHPGGKVSMAAPQNDLQVSTSWRKFTTADGLAPENVTAISEDVEQNMWFGHPNQGATRFDRSLLTFAEDAENRVNFVENISSGPGRLLWIATQGGVLEIEPDANLLLEKNVERLISTTNSDLLSNRVFRIFHDSDSLLWFATEEGASRVGIQNVMSQDGWENFHRPGVPLFTPVNWINEDSLRYIWFATGKGISRTHIDSTSNSQNWLTLGEADGFDFRQVFNILRDKGNNLWFATDAGVYKFHPAPGRNPKEPANWQHYTTEHGLAHDNVRFIFEDSEGHIWFATRNGVNRIDPAMDLQNPENWQKLSKQDGLVSDFVTSIAERKTNAGRELWFGTALGVNKYQPDEALNPWVTYTASSGLPSNIVNSVFVDQQRDEVWFGISGGGVTRYKLKTEAPQTFLDIKHDIVAGNQIEYQFRAADLILQDFELSFQYKFDGGGWHETSDNAVVLPLQETERPVRHVFEVRAVDRDGNIDASPATDEFYQINPDFGGGGTALENSAFMVSLTFPPNQFDPNNEPTITEVKKYELPEALRNDPSLRFVFEILPCGLSFDPPVTLMCELLDETLYKDSGQLTIFRQDSLSVCSNDLQSDWVGVGGTVQTTGKGVRIKTAIRKSGLYAVRDEKVVDREAFLSELIVHPRIIYAQNPHRRYGNQVEISFELKAAAEVTAKVYNVSGRLIKKILRTEQMPAGTHVISWDGMDSRGQHCLTGVYNLVVRAGNFARSKVVAVEN